MSATVKREIAKREERGQKRVKQTGEVFTPMDLCLRMVRQIPAEKLKDPGATFLDNSCGDGNFLVALFKVLSKYHDPEHVLNEMIYGVDLMFDNVEEAKRRLGLKPEDKGWHHIVCADGLTYDYEFAPPPSQDSAVEEF
jgi:type I restriction-modification system DNA methylase subunit